MLEAQSQQVYRDLVLADKVLSKHCNVPEVYPELCTARILTTKLVPGYSIDLALSLPQSVRNAIARTVLIVTIRELFEWRFIQSDPNYANFLYDHPSRTINMIDFGAARRYDKQFVDGYMGLVWAAANKDREAILKVSRDLGFITGNVRLFGSFVQSVLSDYFHSPFSSFHFCCSFFCTHRGRDSGIYRRTRGGRAGGGRTFPLARALRLRQLPADDANRQLRGHLHEVPPHPSAHRSLLSSPEASGRLPAIHQA